MRVRKSAITLVLAILIVLLTFLNVLSDDLGDLVKNSETKGTIRIWYQTNDNAKDNHGMFHKENSIFDAGLMLGYITGTYYGFGAGVTFWAVDIINLHDQIACKCIHKIESGAPGTWLAEAHLSYRLGGTLAKIGRQSIKSPLLNSDSWAVVPNYFEAFMINSTDIPATSITGGFVTQERWLMGKKFEDLGNGIFLIGAVNNSIKNSFLSAWYYHASKILNESKNVNGLYLDAGTKISMFALSAQYIFYSSDSTLLNDTKAYGFKLSWQNGLFELTGAYSSVNSGSLNAVKISDRGIKTPLYTATCSGDGDIAGGIDTDSYKVSGSATPIDGLRITANYGYYDHGSNFTPSPNTGSTSIELIGKYTGIKKVTFFAMYVYSDHNGVGAWSGATADDKLNSIRIWAQYSL